MGNVRTYNNANGRGMFNSITGMTVQLGQFIARCYILCPTVLQRVLSNKLPILPVALYWLTFLLMKLLTEHFVFPFLKGSVDGGGGGGGFVQACKAPITGFEKSSDVVRLLGFRPEDMKHCFYCCAVW